jgi:hypothetical protein
LITDQLVLLGLFSYGVEVGHRLVFWELVTQGADFYEFFFSFTFEKILISLTVARFQAFVSANAVRVAGKIRVTAHLFFSMT